MLRHLNLKIRVRRSATEEYSRTYLASLAHRRLCL